MSEKLKPAPEKAEEPKEHSLVLVLGDDWEGLYADGKLFTANHEIPIRSVFDALQKLGIKIKTEISSCNNDWLEENGCFPTNLSNVKSD
jgi:hypothetical protein